tara:strand:+ start:1063 stop:2097 length:1035 start_codon:yes stop_codon:yes gene_type:complete
MNIKHSKKSGDIKKETKKWTENESKYLKNQIRMHKILNKQESRKKCLLCGEKSPKEKDFTHRSVNYFICPNCNHVQTVVLPPDGYPSKQMGEGFENIYPKLSKEDFESRRDRIYMPKLDWICSVLDNETLIEEGFENIKWLEIGCGAGYFLNAMQFKGIINFKGFDENQFLISEANRHCSQKVAFSTENIFKDIELDKPNIICAFFVLEHIDCGEQIWQEFSRLQKGTILVFSVPTFCFSTLLECSVDNFAARNLDSVLHTQIYTDESINYCLKKAGFEKCAEWLFGQDSQDLCELILRKICGNVNEKLFNQISEKLNDLIDPIQEVMDKQRICDGRHIIAIKR